MQALIKPTLKVIKSRPMASSLDIASVFEKHHKNILRSIENLDCSPEFAELNFELCFKKNDLQNGKPQPYYNMTKDGFTFLVMGFTGAKAAQFKEAYIKAFNEMERLLNIKVSKNSLGYESINTEQQFAIKQAVNELAFKTGKTHQHIYTTIYAYFKIPKYQDLPASKFDEAMKFLNRGEEKADSNICMIPFDKRRSCVYEIVVKGGVLYRATISRSIGVDDRANNGVFR